MDGRVKELAQEVFSFKYKSNPNELNPDHNMDHIHKFAELIVRECIDQVEVFNARMDAGPRHIVEAIKQHFGVENDDG